MHFGDDILIIDIDPKSVFMSQHMVVVLIIDIEPKTLLMSQHVVMILMSTQNSPIRCYNDGVYFVDHLKS